MYLERYGGTYSTDCDDAQDERLTIFEDRLVFADADRERVAEDILVNVSYWGRAAPEGFELALIGGLEADTALVFLIHSDEQGIYILLDPHPFETENNNANMSDETRYYKCKS